MFSGEPFRGKIAPWEAMEQNRKEVNQLLASYEQIVKIKLYTHEFEKTPKKSIKRFLYTSMAED